MKLVILIFYVISTVVGYLNLSTPAKIDNWVKFELSQLHGLCGKTIDISYTPPNLYEFRTAEVEPRVSKKIQTCIGTFESGSDQKILQIRSVKCTRIENVNLADNSNNKMIRNLMEEINNNYEHVCVVKNMTEQSKKQIWYKVFRENIQEDPSILYKKTVMEINLVDHKLSPRQFYVSYKSSILRDSDHLVKVKCFANVEISGLGIKINYSNYCAKKKHILL